MSQWKIFKQKDKLDLWASICIVGALLFMLCFYAPLELYIYNQSDFWFDIYELLPLVTGMFVVGLVIGAVLLMLCHKLCNKFFPKLYKKVCPLLTMLLLATYVQGNYLVGYLPVMEGNYINWEEYSAGRVQTIVLWIVVALMVVIAYKRLRSESFAKLASGISAGLVLMLTFTLVSILFLEQGFDEKLDAQSTIKNEYVFSEDMNFVILLLDSLDSGDTYKMLEEKPEYKEIFEDFTYYANAMGQYPLTLCAIPHILSGELFENETTFEEYAAKVYGESAFLESLENAGYKLEMYDYDMPYVDERVLRFDNVVIQKREVNSYLQFAKLELKLVAFRYAPFDLKRFCMVWSDSFPGLMKQDSEYPAFSSSNVEFYDRLNAAEVETVEEKCFKFIHIEGAHTPFRYDKDLNVEYGGEYSGNIEACMTITEAYLDKLKEAGVYDNSVIIVMADHGLDAEQGDVCLGRQNPILFVKGVGEQHEMQVSQAPISYVDLQEAFARLLAGQSSEAVFDWKEGDERERRYLYYEYEDEQHLQEYISSGHAADDNALMPTGNVFVQ